MTAPAFIELTNSDDNKNFILATSAILIIVGGETKQSGAKIEMMIAGERQHADVTQSYYELIGLLVRDN